MNVCTSSEILACFGLHKCMLRHCAQVAVGFDILSICQCDKLFVWE